MVLGKSASVQMSLGGIERLGLVERKGGRGNRRDGFLVFRSLLGFNIGKCLLMVPSLHLSSTIFNLLCPQRTGKSSSNNCQEGGNKDAGG